MNGDRTHLLIPIHVDALVVGESDRDSVSSPLKNGTVSAAPNYSLLKKSHRIGADLREPLDAKKLENGVHLHFRLPAVAAHGDLGRKPAFPRIPNRWLVQRYHKQDGALRTKAWIVCSDKEAKDIKSAVVLLVSPPPAGAPGDFSYRLTGVASLVCDGNKPAGDYDYSSDDKGAEVELTAVTGGDPGFSAHYPACRSILGFYDDLAGVPADPEVKLSYLVTGWYSGTQEDPWSQFVASLSAVQGADEKRKKLNQWMEERGCVRDFGNKELPAGILCYGTVKDVRRQADGSALTPEPDPFLDFENPKAYWVDLGNTSAEAFAARVAKKRARRQPVDLNLLEDLVTALQIGLFSQGSNAAEMDAELHRQGFAAVAGGKVWVIQQAAAALPQNVPPSPPAPLPPLPAGLQGKLDVLNGLESQCDRHERLFRDYQWELYASWHRWTDALRRGSAKSRGQLEPNLDVLKKFVGVYEREVKAAQEKRDEAKKELSLKLEELSKVPAPVVYSLVEQPAAPFYVPKDPVLLLTGPAAQAKGTRARPDSVTVRVTGEELQSFSYELDQKPNQTFDATDAWLQALGVTSEYLKAIPPWSARLLKEDLLLDEMEITEPPGGKSRKYPKAQEKLSVRPDRPDPFGRFSWPHNPWIPLHLYWGVSWRADDVTSGDLKKHWTLKHEGSESRPSLYRRNTELIPLDGLPPAQQKQVECNGLSFVGLPLFNLQCARAANGTKLLNLMEEIDTSLGSRRSVMVSQALGGLHDALIMRRAGDQLPPLDYSRWNDKDKKHPLFLDAISQVLGGDFHPDSSPVTPVGGPPAETPPFCPLRTGILRVGNLWIIDAFGQRTRVEPGKLTSEKGEPPSLGQSGRLEAGLPSTESPPAVRLHPRLCQPMRLEFAGVSAEAPAAGAGPICGWVVLNRFDQNLVLYAANGRPAGILQKRFATSGKTLFYWVAVPGARGVEAEVSGIRNPHLRDFASFVLSLDFAAGGRFADLVNQAVEATEQRVPEDNPLISVLIGRPLALVRAELRLEMDGLPALDQKLSWTEGPKSGELSLDEILNTSLKTGTRPPPNRFMETGGVEKVRWPVRLGDRRSANDGLVGFFKGEPHSDPLPLPASLPIRDASTLDSHPFYSSWGFDFGNVTYAGLRRDQDLELDCEEAVQVTLLMDPQARVHVTSGFLPKVALELPTEQLKGAKQVREVIFQAAPVLGTPTTPHVPKPSDDYGQWSWAYRPNVTGWAEDPNMVSAAELAGPALGWPTLTEGWLKLKIEPVLVRSLWMKAPAEKPQKGTNVTLAWSLFGADSVAVFRLQPDGTEETSPEKEWSAPPLADECTTLVKENTTFRIKASNAAGYQDYRDIEIQTKE
jgi:hypothetical protein